MKFLILFIFLMLNMNLVYATPKKIEMVFLSPPKTAMLLDIIKKMEELKAYKSISQSDMQNCMPMGDGCFHPQYGYIENKVYEEKKPKLVQDEEVKLKTFNAIETSLIKCEKGNYFDIYCGQASNQVKSYDTEIWFDISSSLKSVDYDRDPNNCGRRRFLESVMKSCPGKINYQVYNTSLKQGGEHSSVCLSYGTNDEKRLLGWIKGLNSNRLLIVTDIDEMSTEMRSFLEENGAKILGEGTKAFTVDDLIRYASEYSKGCR